MILIDCNGVRWFNYRGALIPDVPPHHNITLSLEEQTKLLKQSGAYFLRWTSDFNLPEKSPFWYILKDISEGLETYNSKIRYQIKKGLEHCTVKPITSDTLLKEGYTIYQKALKSYGFSTIPNKNKFLDELQSLDKNWEFWGVYSHTEILIGYSQNLIMDNTCNYSTVKLDPAYLDLYPAYALFFTMNTHYLNERKMSYVHDGSRNLSHETNIQDFLCTKFKFRKAYCTMNIVYRKDIALVVKLLYPFKTILSKIPLTPVKKLIVLLKHEEIRRAYE